MPPTFRGARRRGSGLVVVLLLVIVVVHRDGGGGVVGVHRVALVALAGVNRAQRWLERVLTLGFILGAQVTARGVGLTAGADAALGAVGVTIEGFMSVAGVA